LPELIKQALSNGISRQAQEFIDWCFPPDLRGKSGEAAAKVLAKISKGVVFMAKKSGKMSAPEKLSKIFDKDYFENGKATQKSNYADYSWPRLGKYFTATARHIIDLFNPATVLDVGCAKGFLVYALEQNGVEAWGIDASEYAVENAEEAVRDKIALGMAEKLPYDDNFFEVVTILDVLEHIPERNVAKTIKELLRVAKKHVIVRVVTKDVPGDLDTSHETVKPKEWWEEQFIKHGGKVLACEPYVNSGVWWFNVPDFLIVVEKQ